MSFNGNTLVDCEPNQIKQVFINVVKNAIEAMPAGGKLTIRLNRIEDTIEIQFCDQGGQVTVKVLFVCLGNICRSPMAEAIFRQMVKERGLEQEIEIDSAGLSGWHAGERPHRGTLEILTRHGIPHKSIRSRQVQTSDVQNFDYIVAMDEENLEGLERLGAKRSQRVFRLLDLVPDAPEKNVPDPYYTGNFDEVYKLISAGCGRLLAIIVEELQN